MKTTTTVRKWGNSLAIRVPKSVILNLGLRDNSQLEIVVDGVKATVKPVAQAPQSLAKLLKGVTPANIHGEYDWGESVGKEIW